MNAQYLARAIMRSRWHRNFCLPSYTPENWWECDVFEITKAGYFREYEVKISRGDFFADAEKSKRDWKATNAAWFEHERARRMGEVLGLPPDVRMSKHAKLAERATCGPTKFWYVTPAGLVKPEEVPEFAGLIEVTPNGEHWHTEKEIKVAPKLHGEPVDKKIRDHAKGICYWRLHRLHQFCQKMTAESFKNGAMPEMAFAAGEGANQ